MALRIGRPDLAVVALDSVQHSFQRQIVCEDVDAVVVRQANRHFVLARHIGRAVERLIALGCYLYARAIGQHLLAIEPELVVGGRFGHELIADLLGQRLIVEVRVGQQIGHRAGHGVARHIAAAAVGTDPALVQRLDQRLHIGLADAVELEILPGGDPDGVVAIGRRQIIGQQILLGSQTAARELGAYHELPGAIQSLLLALAARVAVILLVGAMELQQLVCALGDIGGAEIGQLVEQEATQAIADDL